MWSLRKDVLRLIELISDFSKAIAQMQRDVDAVNSYAGGLEERIAILEAKRPKTKKKK